MGKRQEAEPGEQAKRSNGRVEVQSSREANRNQQRNEFVGGKPHDLKHNGWYAAVPLRPETARFIGINLTMTSQASIPVRGSSVFQRYPVLSYFLLTFLVSWSGALAVAAPHLFFKNGLPLPKVTGILMFPAMLIGPSLVGIMLWRFVGGTAGVQSLFAKIFRWRVAGKWYAALLIPPVLVIVVLTCLQKTLSPMFGPNHFYLGILFGVPAGVLEEIGWTGYAFPIMSERLQPFSAAIILGVLWAFWHLPVINFLGAAAPHGQYWVHFFLAFTLAMTAMRVLISWIYFHTQSVLLAQLMHISSTGALVIFSPAVTPAQEAMWYALYGCVLWAVALTIVLRDRQEQNAESSATRRFS